MHVHETLKGHFARPNFFRREWRAARLAAICNLNRVLNEIFYQVMGTWKISSSISLYGECLRSQICHDKTTVRSKTDTGNKFLNPVSNIGLSCSGRVRRLTGILRRAHVRIFILDYWDFQSQLSGFSRILEDFDRAPVIFTKDIYRKTYWLLLWKYFFFQKIRKSATVVTRGIEFQLQPPWQNFRKLSSFSINGRIWLTFRLCLLVQYLWKFKFR